MDEAAVPKNKITAGCIVVFTNNVWSDQLIIWSVTEIKHILFVSYSNLYKIVSII